MVFDVFGRRVIVDRQGERWVAFYAGADGKKRAAKDIVIPSELGESELEQWLDDLCHEWATATQPDVRRIS